MTSNPDLIKRDQNLVFWSMMKACCWISVAILAMMLIWILGYTYKPDRNWALRIMRLGSLVAYWAIAVWCSYKGVSAFRMDHLKILEVPKKDS